MIRFFSSNFKLKQGLAVLMKPVLLTFSVLGLATLSVSAKPKNVECIAPAGAGGGWDFTCRVPAAQVMGELDLVEGNIEVTNMSGGGGGKAYAHVVGEREGDESLIVAASMATAARLGQNVYSGFTADNVRWLGALGADYGVVAVKKDSPYGTIGDLMDALKSGSGRVNFVGGSSAGGWDHLKVVMLADKAGLDDLRKVNYIAFDNGAKAMLEVIGGRADAFTGDTSEVLSQLDAGQIRVLAVLSPARVDRLGNAKTAQEQGLDVIGANWRGFYAPAGISDATYSEWVDVVKAVAESDSWQDLREKNGLAPFASFGSDFEGFVKSQIRTVNQLSKDLGFLK